MSNLSDDLISDIKRDSYLPTAQGNFTDAQLLTIADQKIIETIAPFLVSLNEGFFVESITAPLLASQSSYVLPTYSMWGKVLMAHLVYISGGNVKELSRITHERIPEWSLTGTGDPQVFYLESDNINLIPSPSSSSVANYYIKYWIYRRPGSMVRSTARTDANGTVNAAGAAQVSTINYVTGVVTYTGAPPATYTSSSTHDFYSANSPFHRVGTAVVATAAAGSTQTFAVSSLIDANNQHLLSAGDWVCIKDQTVFPAIPLELQPMLKDLVILSLSRTQMDEKQYQIQLKELEARMRSALVAPGARVVTQPKKISIPTHGILGSRRRVNWS